MAGWLLVIFFGDAMHTRDRVRLGTQYRLDCFRESELHFDGERVLDVGCHDGLLLGLLTARLRVGVDLAPTRKLSSVNMVQADGCHLPFRADSFDQVIATDVIEHVPDPTALVREMLRVARSTGQLFLTTPSARICVFPPFLIGWISRHWGHHWRYGYTQAELRAIVGGDEGCILQEWNAPAFRFLFLPLRLLATLCPSLATRLVSMVARWDAQHREGDQGFFWMWFRKPDLLSDRPPSG